MLKQHLPLILILFLAFFLRLYQLTTPLADWHSWRQADTASVAVEYIKHGVNLLEPKYLDLSSIPSGKENPEGFRMVEFPIIPAVVAWLYPLFPNLEIHVLFRLINICISLGSIWFLYQIVKFFGLARLALISAFIYAVLPYNVFYSRTTLPEVALVFFSLGAMYFALREKIIFFLVFSALALLVKPTAIFYLAVSWYVFFRHSSFKLFIRKYLVPCSLSLVPLLFWRFWITQFPAGIPASSWLLNGNGIRFKGAWFRWLFADRLGRLILGYWGLILLALGFLGINQNIPIKNLKSYLLNLKTRFSRPDKEPPHFDRFILVWTLSLLAYLAIFATGNVQHDYYQYPLVPLVSILVASGINWLLPQRKLISYLISLTSFIFMLAFSWYEVRGFYQINNPGMVQAGRLVDRLVEPEALIIAPYGGDTALLYQTNRRGWPIGGGIEAKIAAGADYYLNLTFDPETVSLSAQYPIINQIEGYSLIKLPQ